MQRGRKGREVWVLIRSNLVWTLISLRALSPSVHMHYRWAGVIRRGHWWSSNWLKPLPQRPRGPHKSWKHKLCVWRENRDCRFKSTELCYSPHQSWIQAVCVWSENRGCQFKSTYLSRVLDKLWKHAVWVWSENRGCQFKSTTLNHSLPKSWKQAVCGKSALARQDRFTQKKDHSTRVFITGRAPMSPIYSWPAGLG